MLILANKYTLRGWGRELAHFVGGTDLMRVRLKLSFQLDW